MKDKKSTIPTQPQNPKGLHPRYYIQKIKGYKKVGEDWFHQPIVEPDLQEIDEGAEYFVLRLDDGGSDPKHIQACRKAVLHYADLIKDHLPELSSDLIERYGNINPTEQ